jgi:ABC-type branched-subunit amino acid transport system permease subunit
MRGGLVGIYLIIYGCLLIIVVRFIPQGLVGWFGQRLRAGRRYARA